MENIDKNLLSGFVSEENEDIDKKADIGLLTQHVLINAIAAKLAEAPYNEYFTEKQRQDVSGTETTTKYNLIDRLIYGAPKWKKSWKNDPEWDKANPVKNAVHVLNKIHSYEEEIMENTKKHEDVDWKTTKHTYDSFQDDNLQAWNILPNKQQRELLEASGYPEGEYGLYSGFGQQDFKDLVNNKNDTLANELIAYLYRENQDAVPSLIMPEVKVTAKAHDSIDEEMLINEIKGAVKWR